MSIDVIPCCADLDHFDYKNVRKEDVESVRKKLGIPADKRVITYLGSIGGWYMIKEMFQFFNQLQQQYPEYVMLLLTKDDPSIIQREAASLNINPDQIFITYADRKTLPFYMALSNCSIFFIRNTFSKMASSPTKHAELMGMGIPVICNDIGDTGNIIQMTQTGILIDKFDDEYLQDFVGKVESMEKLDKSYIRSCAQTLFDLKTGSDKYLQIYNSILSVGGLN